MDIFVPHAALIVTDVQNDFADPSGSLYVSGGEAVVEAANRWIRAARAAGALVAYTQDWHPPHTPHFATDGGVWPVHCVMGTWGAELHPALEVVGPIVRKGTNGEDGYSGFTMRDPVTGHTIPTELAELLRRHGIREVAVCGLATDYCVLATALDAIEEDFTTRLLLDAIAAVNLGSADGELAIERMREAGVWLVDGVPVGGSPVRGEPVGGGG